MIYGCCGCCRQWTTTQSIRAAHRNFDSYKRNFLYLKKKLENHLESNTLKYSTSQLSYKHSHNRTNKNRQKERKKKQVKCVRAPPISSTRSTTSTTQISVIDQKSTGPGPLSVHRLLTWNLSRTKHSNNNLKKKKLIKKIKKIIKNIIYYARVDDLSDNNLEMTIDVKETPVTFHFTGFYYYF